METVLKLVILVVVVPTSALILGYTFLLKMMARMQQRLGPMEAGPQGALQLVADGIKFIQKEDLFPARADRFVFGLAPIVTLVATFLMFVVLPAGPKLVVENLDTGVVYVMAVAGLSVLGVLMAAWGSANKYSLMGGLRAAAQLLAYEIPLVLAALGVVMQAGTMNLQAIVSAQQDTLWFFIPQIIAFVVFMVAAQAELMQTPFDMPLAESELVAGYMTEYSGFRFLLFYISEIATAAALSVLAVTLFLGGWQLPFFHLHGTAANIAGPFVLLAKVMLVAFVIFWVRFSFPRLREDQLQALAWKVLIPLTLANILITGAFKVAFLMLTDLARGLGITLRTMFKRPVTVQYPREKEDHAPRTRGVIALKEENCTVCMLCARDCPVWCIFIEGHKDQGPPRREGGKPRLAPKLDRFDIDYSLCMYCGICVEVCPFDALFWAPEFEYSEPRIATLLHDKTRLGEWMQMVPDKPELEEGAELPKKRKNEAS